MAPLGVCLAVLAACGDDARVARPAPGSYGGRSLIVLGVDGMDPNLIEQYIKEGRAPNLARLAEQGSYRLLGTSNPPQSPVAWSHFSTGLGSHGHGIYDFVHRDPVHLVPYLSTSRTEAPDRVLRLGGLSLPLSSGKVELLRRGRAFWQDLEDQRVPATMVKIPANFPPAESHMAESLAGMGTPDLLGTYGTFQIVTDDPELRERRMSGGVIHAVEFVDQVARGTLQGPPNPLTLDGEIMSTPIEIARDRKRPVALVRLGGADVVLQPGEWSEWVPVHFDPGVLAGEVTGIVRLYLAELRPHLRLYVSPINIDPVDPEMPLSAPEHYVTDLAADVGRFYTQGMAEDTKALAGGALSDDEFLAQADIVFEERMRMLDRELDRYQGPTPRPTTGVMPMSFPICTSASTVRSARCSIASAPMSM
jgi:hypothetical protein